MKNLSRTTLRELKKRYLNILKKCFLLNLMAFSLCGALKASFAEELENIYNKSSYWYALFSAGGDQEVNYNVNEFYAENTHTYEFKANALRSLHNGKMSIKANKLTAISHSILYGASAVWSASTEPMSLKAKEIYILAYGDKGVFATSGEGTRPIIIIDTRDHENGSVTVETMNYQTVQSEGFISIFSDTVTLNGFYSGNDLSSSVTARAVYGGNLLIDAKNINISGKIAATSSYGSTINLIVSDVLNIKGPIGGNHFSSRINTESTLTITGKNGSELNIDGDIILDKKYEKNTITLKVDKGGVLNTLRDVNKDEVTVLTENDLEPLDSKLIIILNQSRWNIGGQESNVHILSSNNGTVDLSKTTADSSVTIQELEGEGTTFNVSNTEVAQTTIGNNKSKKLTVNATSEFNDATNNPQTLAETLSKVLTIQDGEKDLKLTAEEGKIANAMSADFKDGIIQNITTGTNGVSKTVADVMGLQVLSFRNQINDVQKRMGDLRLDKNTHGTWVRTFAGDVKYGDMGLKNKYNTIQAGADASMDNVYLGVMASLTKGDSDMDRGNGEDKTYGMGIYAGYIGDNGWYVDATTKQMHLQNKFKARYNSGEISRGSYKTWGTSVSLEGGKRWVSSQGTYIEPQAEVMYGRVQGIGYTTSAGVKVEQEAFETLIARAGVSIGQTYGKKGSVYVNASVLNDFAGKTKTHFTYQGKSQTLREDMSGAWTEFAIGGTYKLNPCTYVYGELATSKGSDLTNPLQWSLGLRVAF